MKRRLTSLALIALLLCGPTLRAADGAGAVTARVEVLAATPDQGRALVQAVGQTGAEVAFCDGYVQIIASGQDQLRRAVAALCRAAEAAGLKTKSRSTVQAGAPDALDSRLAAKTLYQPTVRPIAPAAVVPPQANEPAGWTRLLPAEPRWPNDIAAPDVRAPRGPPLR